MSRHAWAVAQLEVQREHRVLEVGCGAGLALALLTELSDDVTGVDRSAAMVERAARKAPRARVVGGLDDVRGPFGRLLVVNVANLWRDDAAELSRLRGLTAPGGRVLVAQDGPRGAPDSAPIAARLTEAGWTDVRSVTGDGVAGALATAPQR